MAFTGCMIGWLVSNGSGQETTETAGQTNMTMSHNEQEKGSIGMAGRQLDGSPQMFLARRESGGPG